MISPDGPARAHTNGRRLRALALGVGLAVSLAVVSLSVGNTSAQTPEATSLTLQRQTSWVAPEGTFELDLDIGGTPPGGSLRVEAFTAVTSRFRFDESTRGDNLGPALSTQPPALPLDAVSRTASGLVRVSLPVSATSAPPLGFRLDDRGVYPVRVSILDATGTTRASLMTHLVRVPADAGANPPLAIATIVELAAPLAYQPDLTISMTDPTVGTLQTAVAALSAEPSVALSVAASPETLDALASVERTTGGNSVGELAGSLAGRQLLPRTYVPIDLGSWTETGLFDPDAAGELEAQLTSGPAVLGGLVGQAPTPRVWLGDASLTPLAITRLRFAGTEMLALPESVLEPTTTRSSSSTLLQTFDVLDNEGIPMRSAQVDRGLGERLVSTADPVLNAHLVLAEMAVLDLDRPSQSRALLWSIASTEQVPATTWAALLEGLSDQTPAGGAPMVSPVTLDDAFRVATAASSSSGDGDVLVRRLSSGPPVPLGTVPDEIAASRSRVASFRSLFGPRGGPADPLDRQLLVAQSDQLNGRSARTYLDGIEVAIDAQTAAIVTPEAQQFTLTASSSRIPLTFENRLDVPVRVKIDLASDKLDFPDGSSTIATLAASATTTVDVAVDARTSGAFPVDVTISSPDDGIELGTSQVMVRSTAVSGLGLVLSIGAGVFLVLWWASHFRKVRRRRQLVSPDHPAARVGTATGPLPLPSDAAQRANAAEQSATLRT